jgi:cytochrome c biogenesis protein CcmG, thiol:disulfide interchange protein DsbE
VTARPRRTLWFAGLACVAVSLLVGALLYRVARATPAKADRARAVSAVSAGPSLPVIWSHDATWPAALRTIVPEGTLRLRDLRGHPVVLNFFASWCDACRREAALLAAAARRSRTRIVFIGADVNDYTPDARRFLRLRHVPYVAVRSGSSIIKAFGLIGLPETVYLSRSGRVLGVTRGELTASALARSLRRLTVG